MLGRPQSARPDAVKWVEKRANALQAKKEWRPAAVIDGLLPRGGGSLGGNIPRRILFGEVGAVGDEAHAAAMKQFEMKGFGHSHVQDRYIDRKMCNVGHFGDWLEQNHYGKFVCWEKSEAGANKRCLVAIDEEGKTRMPSEAAVMEYILMMVIGDKSRPKGGRPEYMKGDHVKVTCMSGKKVGEMMTDENKREFGWGAYADVPFRYRGIEQQVLSIRWFFNEVLEKQGGGELNPSSTKSVKQLMKAVAYLLGQRREIVPEALTAKILEAVCVVCNVDSLKEFMALVMMVVDFVWGARAADLYLCDWSEIIFEEVHDSSSQATVVSATEVGRAVEEEDDDESSEAGASTPRLTPLAFVTEAASETAEAAAEATGKGRIVGLTWKRVQTKTDRLGLKDAPKVLQCSTGCTGKLELTKEGKLEGIPCPVHAVELMKDMQSKQVGVPRNELRGPMWGDYCLPCPPASRAVDEGKADGEGKADEPTGEQGEAALGAEGSEVAVPKVSSSSIASEVAVPKVSSTLVASGTTVVARYVETMKLRVSPTVRT